MTARIVCNSTKLRQERKELLASIGMSYDELFTCHAFHDLRADQFEVWLAVRRIDFWLGDD